MAMRDAFGDDHWIYPAFDWSKEFELEGEHQRALAVDRQIQGHGEIVGNWWVPAPEPIELKAITEDSNNG